jgi:hypothetical protein
MTAIAATITSRITSSIAFAPIRFVTITDVVARVNDR